MSNYTNNKPGGAFKFGAFFVAVLLVIWFNTKGCREDSPSVKAGREMTSESMPMETAPAIPAPKLDDTLRKSEIRAMVFLKLEYGLKDEDIAIAAQSWYPNQMMEVAKWRVRAGMRHIMVVTQTRFTGTDINSSDAYHNWDVKIVNKFSE